MVSKGHLGAGAPRCYGDKEIKQTEKCPGRFSSFQSAVVPRRAEEDGYAVVTLLDSGSPWGFLGLVMGVEERKSMM